MQPWPGPRATAGTWPGPGLWRGPAGQTGGLRMWSHGLWRGTCDLALASSLMVFRGVFALVVFWTVLGGCAYRRRSSPGLRERARIGDGADARRVIEGDASIGRDRTTPSELLSPRSVAIGPPPPSSYHVFPGWT